MRKPERREAAHRGYRIVVIDRMPRSGERGWWVDEDATIDEALASVLADDVPPGDWGWPVFLREPSDDEDGSRAITVQFVEAP